MLLAHLTIANLKMILRNRQALFWALAFPLLFVVVFGLMIRTGDSTMVIGVTDYAKDPVSARLVADLTNIETFEILSRLDEDAARLEIEEGDLGYLLVIPQGLAEDVVNSPPAQVLLVYDDTNPSAGVVIGVVNRFLDKANLDLAGAEMRLNLTTEGVLARDIEFVDFMVPGMAVWGVMSFSVFGIATSLASYREKQILKRMQATPLNVRTFFAAQVVAYLIVALAQGTLILVLGSSIFDVEIVGNVLFILILVLVGNIVFLNLGFIVGSTSKSVQAASGLGNAILLPMMFFSGVFFPTDNLPQVIQNVVTYLPLAPIVDAVRGVTIEARDLWDYPAELLIIALWIVGTSVLATRLFRFR